RPGDERGVRQSRRVHRERSLSAFAPGQPAAAQRMPQSVAESVQRPPGATHCALWRPERRAESRRDQRAAFVEWELGQRNRDGHTGRRGYGERPAAPPAWPGCRELAQQLRADAPPTQRGESHPVALAASARGEVGVLKEFPAPPPHPWESAIGNRESWE